MSVELHNGDCVEVMKTFAENSIDAIVCDPPYGLEFMGKDWDNLGSVTKANRGTLDNMVNTNGKPKFQTKAPAFDLSAESQNAMQEWHRAWCIEALRVLKPGGYLLAFSGSRTYHRLACAVEDAGFEIRDSMIWAYGSGFPKGLDISKAIDKSAGAEREVVGKVAGMGKQNPEWNGTAAGRAENSFKPEYDQTIPATDEAKKWDGWNTSLKPAFEPIVLARKPMIGTVAENVLAHGTGGLNIGACRIPFTSEADEKESKEKNQHADFGTDPLTGNTVYGDYSMIPAKNYNPPGRWPSNFMLSHSPDCVLVKKPEQEIWACVSGCPVRTLDEQSGISKSTGGRIGNADGAYTNQGSAGWSGKHEKGDPGFGNIGGASRFFMRFVPFIYAPKANKRERNEGISEGKNIHPTVKPVSVMAYLCRLVTPPKGIVLDPFMGSGTTGVAAVKEGFNFVGIERELEYFEIANARIEHYWGEEVSPVTTVEKSPESSRTSSESEEDEDIFSIFTDRD